MAVSDLLLRLRPTGAPGGAGPVAVPSTDEQGPRAELAPVLDALRPVFDECDAIRADAARRAAAELADAEHTAAAIRADAQGRVSAERAAAAARVRRSSEQETRIVVDDAQRTAARLQRDAEQRVVALVGQVLDGLRADILGRPGDERSHR